MRKSIVGLAKGFTSDNYVLLPNSRSAVFISHILPIHQQYLHIAENAIKRVDRLSPLRQIDCIEQTLEVKGSQLYQ